MDEEQLRAFHAYELAGSIVHNSTSLNAVESRQFIHADKVTPLLA